jgi:NTP pyrophosphatase (non-canonical NTP hydrolase)
MKHLTFNQLRDANIKRLPQFKNSKGGPAHAEHDGSDWTTCQWLQALIGEMGELCEARLDFEKGTIEIPVEDAMIEQMADELADVQTYLDIGAHRMLDNVGYQMGQPQPARQLVAVMAQLGAYANARKKFDRGDYTKEEFLIVARKALQLAATAITGLYDICEFKDKCIVSPVSPGIDLGAATARKFNKVSDRVGSDVYLTVGPVAQ